MTLSAASVRRPIFTSMVTLIVMLLGAVAFSRLPIDLMPDITSPTLTVSTLYPNASPREIEELISRPIEQAMSAVPGVEEVTAVSVEGQSQVRVTFTWGTDLSEAANDIRDRLDRVIPRLPDDAERPTLRKFDLASFPIVILGASSDLDPIQLRKIIDEQVKYRIERVPGVASLDIFGGQQREIHVNLDADKIKALGLSLDQIMARLRADNITLPAGTIERGTQDILVRTPGEYQTLDDLRNTVVALPEGTPIRLRDIATVEDRWQRVTQLVRVNGRPGVRLGVSKQSGTNTVEVAEAILAEVEKITEDLPQIGLVPIIDTSQYIRRSISNLGTAVVVGGLLAIFVLIVFLRNILSTAVIAISIPVAAIATFSLLYFSGFTLNIMTLGGLALGVGMLVDNAIVVLENIFRRRESGDTPFDAAINGSREVAAAIVASTLTTLAVFLPMVFMRGMTGVMFVQLAFVVSFALLCSLVAALTLVPMLAARIPNSRPSRDGSLTNRIASATHRGFTGLENRYQRLLDSALKHPWLTASGCVALLAASAALYPLLGSEFLPRADESEVRVSVEMEVGTNLATLDATVRKIEAIVDATIPAQYRTNTVSNVGGVSWRASAGNTAEMQIALVPRTQRSKSSDELANDLRAKLAGIPGAVIRTRAGQGLFLLRMGTGSTEQAQIDIRGYDLDTADMLAEMVKELVAEVPGVTDVRVSRESGTPEESIRPDRDRAADMKLTVAQVANMLQTVLSGTRTGYFREGGDQYPIRVQVADAERMSIDELLDLTVTNADREPVVLRNVVTSVPDRGPIRIERKGQERVVTVSANISGRNLGEVNTEIAERLKTIPPRRDFSFAMSGDFEEQQKSFRELLISLVLALVLVYMVLACQYESLRHPLVVMFSVPFAGIGVILMLFLTDTTINVQSAIGCIMLGGIVVNSAILLVDQTNLLRREHGMSLMESASEAGRRRLRPILMTTLTTVLGLMPLALGLGEGGEAQAPMARAVIGGLLSSTAIVLLFVPVLYTLLEGRKDRTPTGDTAIRYKPQ